MVLLVACAAGGEDPCRFSSECARGMVCVEGWCATEDGGSEIDAGTDAAMSDGGVDASTDASVDASTDANVDASTDAGPCGAGPCTGWVLASSSTSWEPFRASGSFAPTTTVRAAFDIQSRGEAYLLTDSTYHVLRLSDRTFTSAGGRSDLFPELAGTAIRNAGAAPPTGTRTQDVIIISGADIHNTYNFDAPAFTFTGQVLTIDLDDEWSAPNAPSHANIHASWWANENPHGWVLGAADTCDPVTVHQVFVTSSLAHPLSTAFGVCSRFMAPVAFTTFPPFALAQAPSAIDIGGAFYWSDELWILAP